MIATPISDLLARKPHASNSQIDTCFYIKNGARFFVKSPINFNKSTQEFLKEQFCQKRPSNNDNNWATDLEDAND